MYDQLQLENQRKNQLENEVHQYNQNVMNAEKFNVPVRQRFNDWLGFIEARQQGEALSTPIPDASGNHDARDSGSSEPCSEEVCGAKKVSKKLIL